MVQNWELYKICTYGIKKKCRVAKKVFQANADNSYNQKSYINTKKLYNSYALLMTMCGKK